MVESTLHSLYEENFWTGDTVEMIEFVRLCSKGFGFDKSFAIEFGNALVRLD